MFARIAIAVLSLFLTDVARASLEGALWDPNQGGEGWTFESQNDLVAGTWYMYESDGRPSFRIFVAQSTTNAQGQFVLTGDLFRVVTRGTSVREGAFSGTFAFSRGSFRGTVNAAGVVRQLESFQYAYADALDKFHGIWSFSLLGRGVSESIAVQFSRSTAIINGTRTKQFVTSLGQPGAMIFDEASGLYLAIANVGGGVYYCFEGESTDDATVGVGYYGNAACGRTSDTFFNVGKSFVNTEQEYAAAGATFRSILGFQSFPPAKRADHSNEYLDFVRALRSGVIESETAGLRKQAFD